MAAPRRPTWRLPAPLQDPPLLAGLIALAAVAFLVRLLPVLWSGGLRGVVDYDDAVYFGSAVAWVHGRIPYTDFFSVQPPGILYVLSPFAALTYVVHDSTAFAAARLGFMLLGALNTLLVGVVAARLGRLAALAAAALYAVWEVPAYVERTTWLTAPQSTLLLVALVALVYVSRPEGDSDAPGSVGPRRAALLGALLGAAFTIQIWGVVTGAAVFAWVVVHADPSRNRLRVAAAYVVGGSVAVVLLLLPFFAGAGLRMIRFIILDQIGRGDGRVGLLERLRGLEGLPAANVRAGIVPDPVVVGFFAAAAVLIAWVAWRRPGVRLPAFLVAVQVTFLFVTPSFWRHYAGWYAPTAALALGGSIATLVSWSGVRRWARVPIGAAYGALLAGLLVVTLVPRTVNLPPPAGRVPLDRLEAEVANARCVTADSPTLLILANVLVRDIDRGCPVLVSPTALSFDLDPDLRRQKRRRQERPEFQAAMRAYYASSDAVMLIRGPINGLSNETLAAIREQLPVRETVGRVRILLRNHP